MAETPKKSKKAKQAGKKKPDAKSTKQKKATTSSRSNGVSRAIKKVLRYMVLPGILYRAWQELRLVTWPSWKLSRQLTFAVLVFAVIFAALISLLDWGLNAAFKALFLR